MPMFFLKIRRPPRFYLIPYTTLFRFHAPDAHAVGAEAGATVEQDRGHAAQQAALDHAVQVLEQALHRYADLADRKSTRLNSSHLVISNAVFCLETKMDPLGYCRMSST